MVAELTFYRKDELFLGNTQIRLLKQVAKDGSINCAAKNLKMSYQHAWHLLDKLNLLSPVPIVIRQKGGKDGGGCRISPYGMKLIRTYEKKVADINRFSSSICPHHPTSSRTIDVTVSICSIPSAMPLGR